MGKALKQAIVRTFSGSTLSAFRIQRQISDLLDRLKPRILLFTYEGHSWERLLAASTKTDGRNITSVGYQHASISRLQHAACRPLGMPFDPDCLFASGHVGKKRLMNSPLNPKLGITVIGGNRAAVQRTANAKTDKTPCILVLPEGLLSECALLLNYSIECAKLNSALRFIWRLHPILTFENLVNKCPHFKILPENVRFSNDSLESDINQATHVLYRGTTAVVKALSLGLRPLYLSIPGEMTIDPLYDLNVWKAVLLKPSDLIDSVSSEKEMSANDINQAIRYGDSFYSKLSADTLLPALDAILAKYEPRTP
jgi:hypothetical protein